MEEFKPVRRRWLWGLAWVVVLFFCAMTLRSLFGQGGAGARGRVAIVNVIGPLINTTHQVDLIRRYRESIKGDKWMSTGNPQPKS